MVTTDSPVSDPPYSARMDRDAALEALPEPYGLALTLHDAGHDHATIADLAGVPLDAIATLLEVGLVKLAILLTADACEQETPDSELGV